MTDPTLAALVPSRTRGRNTLLVAFALVLMVAAAFSPRVLRPQFAHDGYGAALAVGVQDRTLVTTITATPQAWPFATMRDVVAPPGTQLVGAWLLPPWDQATAAAAPVVDQTDVPPPDTWRRALDQLYPGSGLDETTTLPQRVRGGAEVSLAIAWRIDDCEALAAAARTEGTSGGDGDLVRWRTALGTTSTSAAPAGLGPLSDPAQEALRDAGVC